MKDLLTIVIPCKNENSILIETLSCLKDQEDIKDTRIIIADCSTDNTISLVRFYNQFANLNIEFIEGDYPAIARNNGAKLATTPYILFLDADIWLFDKDHLNSCINKAMTNNLSLVTCNIGTDDKYSIVYECFFTIQKILSIFSPISIGGFMLFNTHDFHNLGGFDEKDKFAEDYHLSSKVSRKRFVISNKKAFTTSRRIKKKGLWFMIKMATLSIINKNNKPFFHSDYDYWK
jgi:glycosyltransferase involved in cell wall biosynthesis